METKQLQEPSAPEYTSPAIERTVVEEELERELHYAGLVAGSVRRRSD
jgi:hypothetical protein